MGAVAMSHSWNPQSRSCRQCGVKRWMVDEGVIINDCQSPPVCTCSAELKADVRRNGSCIRGGCPIVREHKR